MIVVPFKKSVSLSFAKPFGAYIQSAYEQDPNQYVDELRKLDVLREDCLMASASRESKCDLAYYLGQLGRLTTRFPLGEDGIKIPFMWYNFGGKEKKLCKAAAIHVPST